MFFSIFHNKHSCFFIVLINFCYTINGNCRMPNGAVTIQRRSLFKKKPGWAAKLESIGSSSGIPKAEAAASNQLRWPSLDTIPMAAPMVSSAAAAAATVSSATLVVAVLLLLGAWFPVSRWTVLLNSSGLTWTTLGDCKYIIAGGFLAIFLEPWLTVRCAGLGPCSCFLVWELIFN